MAEGTVRSPYNFVPFSGKILAYPGSPPAHDSADPSLKTGEIRVTLTAGTPVFMSDGNPEAPHFFRGPDGRFTLPGSTIRGMVRQNMMILGFGLVRPGEDLEDKRVFYRKIAAARDSTGADLMAYYHDALGVRPVRAPSGKTYSIPSKVRAGYLRKTGAGYVIQPLSGPWLRVSKAALAPAGLENLHGAAQPVYYASSGDSVTEIRRAGGPVPAGMRRGTLLCPGLDTGGDGTRGRNPRPPAHRYVFPPANEAAAPIEISKDYKEDELSYAADWESRKNNLKAYYNPDFWKLPEPGEEKPVFYVRHDGHIYFGMSLFPRIGYRFSLKDGLPPRHRQAAEDPDFLDYPRAVLGFAGRTRSLRSRVSFGDFPARGEPAEQELVTTVLGHPKPGYCPGYTVNGQHYNTAGKDGEPGFRLRGCKAYWLKEAPAVPPSGDSKAASGLRPLPAGTVFSGVIRYRNLRAEELGLLLWALRLEPGCFQSLGMGKPLGFGRMEVTIDGLREFCLPDMYGPDLLCPPLNDSPAGTVEEYIAAYDTHAARLLRLKQPSIKSREEIRDFFFLRSTLRQDPEEAGYMALSEYKSIRNPLPSAAWFRKAAEAEIPETPAEAVTEEDLYEALRRKFKRL